LCVPQVLAEKVHIRALSIAQRVSLLHEGLSDTAGKDIVVFVDQTVSSCKQLCMYVL